jgi:hypothetical protein
MRTYALLLVVALLFLLASAHAQEPECLIVKKISSSHRTLHQGGDIVLTARLVTSHCRIPIDAIGRVRRAVLSVDAPDGFKAGQPTIEIGEIEGTPDTGNTWMAHEMTVHFPLHAY